MQGRPPDSTEHAASNEANPTVTLSEESEGTLPGSAADVEPTKLPTGGKEDKAQDNGVSRTVNIVRTGC